jgi:hypothetical protein
VKINLNRLILINSIKLRRRGQIEIKLISDLDLVLLQGQVSKLIKIPRKDSLKVKIFKFLFEKVNNKIYYQQAITKIIF